MAHIPVISGSYDWKMHKVLVDNLDIMKEQNKHDWDFKMLISGDGMTRTGKSTLATQIAQYVDPSFAKDWKRRMIFDGKQLIDTAYKIGTNKALVYDEAKQGLDSKRQMEAYTKNLLDFFSQCGNLNHEIIVVLPEFFELPKSIAMTQSIFLINCFAKDGFKRGYFDFFNRKDKRYLYIKGVKYLDYKGQRPTFRGTFNNYMPFDRVEYETYKKECLSSKKKDTFNKVKSDSETHKNRVKILIQVLIDESKFKVTEIAERLGISRPTVYDYLKAKKKT